MCPSDRPKCGERQENAYAYSEQLVVDANKGVLWK